jgi:hypothetical protein
MKIGDWVCPYCYSSGPFTTWENDTGEEEDAYYIDGGIGNEEVFPFGECCCEECGGSFNRPFTANQEPALYIKTYPQLMKARFLHWMYVKSKK